MVTYLARSAWTDEPRGGATLTGDQLEGCSVHYPADGNVIYADLRGDTQAHMANVLEAYRRFHVDVRGWADIGYQAAGDQWGRVWDLRGITRVPAASASDANPDANHEWGAFLFIIGNNEQPTAELIEAYRHWRHTRWLPRWAHATAIRGHRQVPGAQTSCPGDRTISLINSGALAADPHQPEPAPAPTTRKAPPMFMVKQQGTDRIWLIDGQVRRHVRTVTAMRALAAAGVPLDTEHPISSRLLRSLTPAAQGPDITDLAPDADEDLGG
jgi:hypothetical protein